MITGMFQSQEHVQMQGSCFMADCTQEDQLSSKPNWTLPFALQGSAIVLNEAVESDASLVRPGKEKRVYQTKSGGSQFGDSKPFGPADHDNSIFLGELRRQQQHSKEQQKLAETSGDTDVGMRMNGVLQLRSSEIEPNESGGAIAPLANLMNSLQLPSQTIVSQQSWPTHDQPAAAASQFVGNSASQASVGHDDEQHTAANVVMLTSTVQTHNDFTDTEYVEDSDLPGLARNDLLVQCLLRGKLKQASEEHEIELGNMLNDKDEEIETMKEEHANETKRLDEEITQLKKENTLLHHQQNARLNPQSTGTLPRESKEMGVSLQQNIEILTETLTGPTAAAVQMITILFTSKLQDFRIRKIIAHGCEGAVFLAESLHHESHLLTGNMFAVKVMFNVFGHSTFTQVRSFYQTEYQALCAMPPHPNIIRLFAFFYDRINVESLPDLPPTVAENARMLSLFLVMEHIPRTLEQGAARLREEGNLTAKQVMKWSLDIFTAIQHLLEHHFVHRDLKLNNVLVTDKGSIKICDFGCSIQLSDDMTMFYAPGASLGGNPAHIPPELLNAQAGSELKCESQDLWASGVMVHEMACGVSPFFGLDQRGYRISDLPELRIKNERSGEVSEVDVIFPAEFCEIVKSLLEFDPSKRPQVQEVIAVTRRLLNNGLD